MARLPELRAIIPPHVEDQIEKNGTPAQRERVRRSRALMRMLRARRDLAPAIEPQEGEQREVRDAQGTANENPSRVVRREDSPDTGDPAVDACYDHAGVTFAALHHLYDRHGPDGAGGLMLSILHFDEQPGGVGWDNAAYVNGRILVGDGDIFPSFWKSPGVFYHEWAHWVTETTCGLVYANQAGGNNEHGSDWMAALIEQYHKQQAVTQASWLIGAELFSEGLRGRGLRDMLHPGTAYDDPLLGRDPQIVTAEQYRAGMDPHLSSSVGNLAFATAAMQIGGNAWEHVGRIWYGAWAHRMHSRTDFAGLAAATLAEAEALFGADSRESLGVHAGWERVKVVPAGPAEPVPAPSPCEAEWLAVLRSPVVARALASVGADREARKAAVRLLGRLRTALR